MNRSRVRFPVPAPHLLPLALRSCEQPGTRPARHGAGLPRVAGPACLLRSPSCAPPRSCPKRVRTRETEKLGAGAATARPAPPVRSHRAVLDEDAGVDELAQRGVGGLRGDGELACDDRSGEHKVPRQRPDRAAHQRRAPPRRRLGVSDACRGRVQCSTARPTTGGRVCAPVALQRRAPRGSYTPQGVLSPVLMSTSKLLPASVDRTIPTS